MTAFKLTLSLVSVIISYITGIACDCPIPPRFWCDSTAISLQCGVLQACQSWHQSNSTFQPVKIEVYYETYCPNSKHFITTQLFPTWKKLQSSSLMNPVLIPYGKASSKQYPDGNYSFTCQHGAKECNGNIIQNCLIKHTNYNVDSYLPIIDCMESSADPDEVAKQCVIKGGVDWSAINTCAQGPEGNALMYQAGVMTSTLKPALTWVPWIVLNGVHSRSIQYEATSNLLKLVCETYKGELPTPCKAR